MLNLYRCYISFTDIDLVACILQYSRETYLCVHNYKNNFCYKVKTMIIFSCFKKCQRKEIE